MGEVAGIDYGPVGRIFGQYAYWVGIYGGGGGDDDSEGGFKDPRVFWQQLLENAKEKVEEDVVYDAWKGPGNMWVFVRPDRYLQQTTHSINLIDSLSIHSASPSQKPSPHPYLSTSHTGSESTQIQPSKTHITYTPHSHPSPQTSSSPHAISSPSNPYPP